MKRPAFQFYPADWRKDAALQSCSVAAQGLWINILCIAHECDPYGHLTVNGKAMNPAQIGRLVGLSAKECSALLDELQDAGVSSMTDGGTVYSRRMVRDEQLRETRAQIGRENGAKGAEHGHKGAIHGVKGGRPTGAETPPQNPPNKPGQKPPQNPLPSSSSSSSSSRQRESAGARASPVDNSSDGHPTHTAAVPAMGEEDRQLLAVIRADLLPIADTVWRKFCEHKPPRQRTQTTWRQWVLDERPPGEPRRNGHPPPPAATDPNSRASVEAVGISLGIGPWNELSEQWTTYRARVRHAQSPSPTPQGAA